MSNNNMHPKASPAALAAANLLAHGGYTTPEYSGAAPLVHGVMQYHCSGCRHSRPMFLEEGVEGELNKKQPCPFIISCHHCGSLSSAAHINWHRDKYDMELTPLPAGQRFFKLDETGGENACGHPRLYTGPAEETTPTQSGQEEGGGNDTA